MPCTIGYKGNLVIWNAAKYLTGDPAALNTWHKGNRFPADAGIPFRVFGAHW